MDDWDEIFKGPHWNLLANGEWATANFKPWNYCLIVFIVYMWYIESCKMLFIWKKSRCSKNKNKKRGATSLKKKEKKRSNIGSCPQLPVILYLLIDISCTDHTNGYFTLFPLIGISCTHHINGYFTLFPLIGISGIDPVRIQEDH